jgi:hypothetical protein
VRLTLKRSGTFKCHWSEYENRCGTNRDPIQEYKYECEIETNDGLDEHGFVVDQIAVNQTMQKLFFSGPDLPHTARSCERIAMAAVYEIVRLVGHSVAEPYRVRVGVGVIPPKNVKGEAMIYAEWKP